MKFFLGKTCEHFELWDVGHGSLETILLCCLLFRWMFLKFMNGFVSNKGSLLAYACEFSFVDNSEMVQKFWKFTCGLWGSSILDMEICQSLKILCSCFVLFEFFD